MGCGGLCGVKQDVKHTPCDDCTRATAWASFLNPWGGSQATYPPVGANPDYNPYDASSFGGASALAGLDTGGDGGGKVANTDGPAKTSTGGSGIPDAAWGTIDAGIRALGAFGATLANNDVERARIAAQREAAAAGASDAVISALGGRAPQYTTSNVSAPGDSARYSSAGGSSSGSSWVPWAAAAGAAFLLLKGGKGLRL